MNPGQETEGKAPTPQSSQELSPSAPNLGRNKARLALAFGVTSLTWVIMTATLIMLIFIPVLTQFLANLNADGTDGAIANVGSALTVVFASGALALFPTLALPFSIIGLVAARTASRRGTPCPWALTFNLIACLIIGLALLLGFFIFVL